ncbi:hypothetical protein QYE76_043541 [Lolium multiflorum]|uniref:TF-B3 domain-containing protein n=1 Tax=Lolium multiflorum TaxID=4521 RepID=A0AAD8TIX0_LOLMU|nr:hypothetical protein QYE76_043541 [Lolium multiflorum]
MPSHDSAGIERGGSRCGTNSKDPQRIRSFASDGVGDSSTNAADVTGIADDLPCTDRVPTDDANCRGCSSEMPSDRGLGLMESCKLTRDIGSQTSGESDLPRFGALDEMDGSMASRIDNEKASTDVDDSRWEGYDISSSEDEYEVPSSDDDDSIFGDPVSESDNMDIDDEDSISDTHDEPTSENTSDVVVIRNSELTYYGDSDLEDFAYEEDVPEQSKSLEGGVSQLSKSECKSEVTGSSQLDHTKHEDDKDPYDIDAEMNRQRKYEALPGTMHLREASSGFYLWIVDVIYDARGKMYLHIGWEKFARHHSLEAGFILLFSYFGDRDMSVKVFDETRCRRDYHGHHGDSTDEEDD